METFSVAKVRVTKEEDRNEFAEQEPQAMVTISGNVTTSTNVNLIINSEKECRLKCWRCGLKFEEEDAVKAHIFQHHPDEAPNRLRGHVKLFKCDGCDNVYRSTKYLLKHMIMHDHMGKGLLNHECKVCGLKFLYHSNLNKHLVKHERQATMIKLQQKKHKRKLECGICHKVFIREKYFDRHAKAHNDNTINKKKDRSKNISSNHSGGKHTVGLESSAVEDVEYVITEFLEDENEPEDGQFAFVSTGAVDMEHVIMKIEKEVDIY